MSSNKTEAQINCDLHCGDKNRIDDFSDFRLIDPSSLNFKKDDRIGHSASSEDSIAAQEER